MTGYFIRNTRAFALCAPLAWAIFYSHPMAAQELTQSNRLAPITSWRLRDEWEPTFHRSLIKGPGVQLWMMVTPSFGRAYALELDCSLSKGEGPKTTAYTIRLTEAKTETGGWTIPPPPPPPGGTSPRIPYRFKSKTRAAAFPADAAQEVIKAWVHMLKETRYPTDSEFVSGMDGVSYEFYAWWDRWEGKGQSLMGWTWSPSSGPTAMLVGLGEDLIAYVKASPKDQRDLLTKCLEEAKAIQAYQYP